MAFSYRNLKIKWKILVLVFPLAVIPVMLVGNITGYIANKQAYLGITEASKADLDHMARYTTALLNAHYRQFDVYQKAKKDTARGTLASMARLSYNLADSFNKQYQSRRLSLQAAMDGAKNAIRKAQVGESGYIYVLNSKGVLISHVAREGENIINEKDESGRFFIQEIVQAATRSRQGDVLYSVYPWRNVALGEKQHRQKLVAFIYFKDWDWIIAAGGYLDETHEIETFENRSFEDLKNIIKSYKVGDTGYIYCMTGKGVLTIHPAQEGENIYEAVDSNGFPFIKEMTKKKDGWIRYPWKNPGDTEARMKIVRYIYFEPWDWIVAVGSYENEFYQEANLIKRQIFDYVVTITLLASMVAVGLVLWVSSKLTDPIEGMIETVRRIKSGEQGARMEVSGNDEIGELAGNFNTMIETIEKHQEMESTLNQQTKMVSLGVLASEVAHEINNPLGVILGYASHLEGKIPPSDPAHGFVQEIKNESRRCKKIVENFLSYARIPRPELKARDINALIEEICDFAANHADFRHLAIVTDLDRSLPPAMIDEDQIRQVAINLIANAAGAVSANGRLFIKTEVGEEGFVNIYFEDNGAGISPEDLEKIFEPFYTTKTHGTGLGLPIVRQIIKQHLGNIRVESIAGKGTTVTVSLPLKGGYSAG